ncbi:Uncharacterised protein [uncultured archaeon]|nr:Uncharacterised protein [uncultured archaeon]
MTQENTQPKQQSLKDKLGIEPAKAKLTLPLLTTLVKALSDPAISEADYKYASEAFKCMFRNMRNDSGASYFLSLMDGWRGEPFHSKVHGLVLRFNLGTELFNAISSNVSRMEEKGEWLEIVFLSQRVKSCALFNGYQKGQLMNALESALSRRPLLNDAFGADGKAKEKMAFPSRNENASGTEKKNTLKK